ncbi:hypothetical protein Pla22_08340 [Rubripirellula amarantea]|uniref:Uncharacterized protein n=1 Tax=Rubripirellula amarantea TaxID=2527999 RepID=A0A5C5WQX5_9BACT|nr:hypothetical protein [Rubripirellula amarantea]TWT53206.1 hypothetical protein Pla22_08340 [Rubripirellula amarantea]
MPDYVKNASSKKLQASLPFQACLVDEFYRFNQLGQDRFIRRKLLLIIDLNECVEEAKKKAMHPLGVITPR